MGTWAAKYLGGLPEPQLHEYERILNRETIDIYNYITGKEAPPAELRGPVLESLQAHVAASPLGRANPEVRERAFVAGARVGRGSRCRGGVVGARTLTSPAAAAPAVTPPSPPPSQWCTRFCPHPLKRHRFCCRRTPRSRACSATER
jgi:hypothetical protein